MKPDPLEAILERRAADTDGVIATLEDVQTAYGYLPEAALRKVATAMGRSLTDLYGVATFYKAFRLKPRGKHLISVCVGTACHVRGAEEVVGAFERALSIRAGETTADGDFTLETVHCLGACALGPIVVVDGRYFAKVSSRKVSGILKAVRKGLEAAEAEAASHPFLVEARCPLCRKPLADAAHPLEGLPSIRVRCSLNGHSAWCRLSSRYGSRMLQCEPRLDHNAGLKFSCPHCGSAFPPGMACNECLAPTVAVLVGEGASLHICSRIECGARLLDMNPPEQRRPVAALSHAMQE